MENLYKLNEYSGNLPNPKHFPIRDGFVVAIKDKPNAFCDGFMLDLLVRRTDRKILEKKISRTVDAPSINVQFEEALISNLLLSEPEFIYDFSYPSYVLFTPEGNPTLIQVKYYKYFRNRYSKCSFYKRDEDSMIIAVKLGEEVIGLCMPMFFEPGTLNKIKEERK